MTTFIATPGTWFDLPREATSAAAAGVRLTLAVTDKHGHAPLADVRLDELMAVHRIFGGWCATLSGDTRPASLHASEYARFLSASRSLLRQRASLALANPGAVAHARVRLLALPPVGHPLFAQPTVALEVLKPLIALEHAPSLSAWISVLSTSPGISDLCRRHTWLRLIMQKVASEDRNSGALACLRTAYGTSDDTRRALLTDEIALLEQAGLEDLREWARSLGVDRPSRKEQALPPGRSTPSSTMTANLTVLVPAFQHESFVEAALQSVLAQTWQSFKILLIDDRSTDRTVERARLISDPRLAVRVNDRNLGLADSVLRALGEVTTPYVAVLNSDDLFHPDRLERCLAVLEQHAQVQVVATGVAPIDRFGTRLTPENCRRLFDGDAITDWVAWFAGVGHGDDDGDLFAALLERNFLVTSSNIVCRTGFLRGGADRLAGLKYCFDWQVLLEAAASDALVCLPDELLGYRLHETNTVWFDSARRQEYVREVNRVLATALARWRQHAAGGPAGVDVARGCELIEHASRHPEARGFLLYAIDLLGEGALEKVPAAGGGTDSAIHDRGHWRPEDVAAAASRALADTAREQVSTVHGSPEWLLGDLLWNRLRFWRIGQPAARLLRWGLDRRNRYRLSVRRVARRLRLTRPTAIVASSWRFPVHSHTFVYQEMQALEWMGLAPLVFCCASNDRGELHAIFDRLWRRRVVLRTEQERNREDFEYFVRTRGERVDALLARLATASGLTRDTVLREPAVMMGFTFARHVELSGAVYLHTYFFYDQSLMALIAGFLLGIPRGVTAYADHMLQDYPLKCVALHLELADVVVATSRRIKRELSAIGSAQFDEKILVKPNGVDVARFTYVDAATRLQSQPPWQLISVSRIEPKKGLVHLVKAAGILKARGLPILLNIVGGIDAAVAGSAQYLGELQDAIERGGLASVVTLHGTQTQSSIATLLQTSHVYVAPYVELASGDKDGIPTSLLEAMATGLPVVTTDSGSIDEAVTDGVEGFCVPQHDAGSLAAAIQRLIEDKAVYTRMSAAARGRVISEFDARITEVRLHERIRTVLTSHH